jgi:hypothetical protein
MTPLLLVVASLLAAFGIPADLRNQTIHTIVTKPVERFEIVLGRFFGYGALMTLVLLAMTGISLLYVSREIDVDAQEESMKARVPVFGNLRYAGRDSEGTNVGREWEYRRYIEGGPNSPARAIWSFKNLSHELLERPGNMVPCEFSFDIFRTQKGEEGKGVFCSFAFHTRSWDPRQKAAFEELRDKARQTLQAGDRRALIDQATEAVLERKPTEAETKAFLEDRSPTAPDRLISSLLAEKFGYFEIPSKEVYDYHTQGIEVPVALLRNALAAEPRRQPGVARQAEEKPALEVSVKCENSGQYVGMAKYDFYILAAEKTFAWNFVKGSLGLWMRLCLVIGLAIVLSTYLSGVIAWLTTMFLYLAGSIQEYVRSIVENTSVGGGPMESFLRLVRKESLVTPLDPSPGYHLAMGVDYFYRLVLRVCQSIFPDVDRFDWSDYVAEGFNIGSVQIVLLSMVILAGYLLPCALVAYYLMRSREIASS